MATKCGTVVIGADMSVGLVDKDKNTYYVEKITDWWISKKGKGAKVQLRVKWVNWDDPRDDTWEPLETTMEDCPAVVAEYIRTTAKKKAQKQRLVKAYEEAKRELAKSKGIQFPEEELESVSPSDEANDPSPAPKKQQKKKGKKKKASSRSAPGTNSGGSDKKRQEKGSETHFPCFSFVTSGDFAGHEVPIPEPRTVHEPPPPPNPTTSTSKQATAPTPPKEGSLTRKEKVAAAAGKTGGEIPGAKKLPIGQRLAYDQVKVLRYLKADGVVHRCFPESAFVDSGAAIEASIFKVPLHIGATMDLPELGTVGYWVKLGEEDTYGLVFREVAKRCFPVALKSYLKNEEWFVRVPMNDD